MKQYKIIASNPSTWGNEVSANTIIDEPELDRLAVEWKRDDETVAECKARLLHDLNEI